MYLAGFFLLSQALFTMATKSSPCTPDLHVQPEVTWNSLICTYCSPGTVTNDTLWANYNGTLYDSGKLFDSSYSAQKPWPLGDPFSFTLGIGQVIKG
jgi:FKBP-type peptidyl-prolyl cis-trans isomerase